MSEKTYRSFDEWYNEIENYGLRSERLTAPVEELKAAFEAGKSSHVDMREVVRNYSENTTAEYKPRQDFPKTEK